MKNLKSDSSTDWSLDKFGQAQPPGSLYANQLRKNDIVKPIENETVAGFTTRIMNMIQKQEEINTQAHIYGRKTWFTHRTPSTCWLCDDINYMWQLFESLVAICESLPNKGTSHVYTYTNKNHLTVKKIK